MYIYNVCDIISYSYYSDIDLPEKTTPVGTIIQQLRPVEDTPGKGGGPLDMTNVLYNTTYDERVRKVRQ